MCNHVQINLIFATHALLFLYCLGSSPQFYSVFTRYYSQLVDNFDENLLRHCVGPEILLHNDVIEIQRCTSKHRAATLLLKKIGDPLKGGDTKNLHEYLKILEEHGSVDTKSLSCKIMRELEPVATKTDVH